MPFLDSFRLRSLVFGLFRPGFSSLLLGGS
jgi:hypothetical protein